MGREFGRRIRQLRDRSGLSQKTLAELAGISRRWLAKIEAGAEPRLPDAVHLADELARRLPGLRVADLLTNCVYESGEPPATEGDCVNRRQFTRVAGLGLAMTATGSLYLPKAWETIIDLERLASDKVDAHLLADLGVLTHAYGRQTFTMRPESLLPTVRYHYRRLKRLLTLSPPPFNSRLKSLSAETAALAGQLSWRAGEDIGAQVFYAAGEALAIEACEAPLHAFILGLRSVLYSRIWQDDRAAHPHSAMALLNEAISIAGRGSSPYLRTFLSCVRGEEAAAAGKVGIADHDLDQAERASSELASDAESGFLTHWNAARLVGYRAHCALLLPGRDAVSAIEQALAATDPSLTGARSATLADLAAAYSQRNEIERSCSLLLESLTIAADGGSEAHIKRIAKVRRSYPDGSPCVKELDDRLRILWPAYR